MQLHRRTLLVAAAAPVLLVSLYSWINPHILTLIPRALSSRQHEYQSLTGNSRIPLPLLEPTWNSLCQVLPDALFNGLFQPIPGAGGQKIYLFFSLELYAIWIIVMIALYFRFIHKTTAPFRSNPSPSKPTSLSPRHFSIACLLLAIPGMLLIGYIIPFVGAIVRYRSIYLPFLLAPCLTILPFPKLKNALTFYIFK
jgi:hypothetical protein